MSDPSIDQVIIFVEKAGKIGKYPGNSAQSLRNAVKLISQMLDVDESRAASYVAQHIDDLVGRYVNTQAQPPSSRTLASYKSRALRAINDAREHDTPMQMSSSRRVPRKSVSAGGAEAGPRSVRHSRRRQTTRGAEIRAAAATGGSAPEEASARASNAELVEYQFPLRRGVLISIRLPADFGSSEAKRVVSWVETLSFEG